MITAYLHQRTDTLRPDQLAMLQRVFDRACASSGITKSSLRAEGLAATLFHLFQEGVDDEDKLNVLMARIEMI